MNKLTPPVFELERSAGNRLSFGSKEGHKAHVFVLEEDLIRVLVLPGGTLQWPRTWAIAPGADDVSPEGRDRHDRSGFSLPAFSCDNEPGLLRIGTPKLRLSINLKGFCCRWEVFSGGEWRYAAADRYTQSYNFGWWDRRTYHYLGRDPQEKYFGLGERSGDANRAGQRYRLTNLDAMGYSARTSDPLYKHIPFYITWRPQDQVSFGLYYDTVADCTFDFGREMDNYHGLYRYYVADFGDLDYYVIAGDTPAAITRRFTWLTGRPALMPKWSLGYSGSTMSYTEAPDAQLKMNEFLENCRTHDIPCSSFHLSSGYTSRGERRYVFHWNREKFPDPKEFVQHYLDHGVHLCANIKPCLLADHPHFAEVAERKLCVHDTEGRPAFSQFWDEAGAYLDFTNPETRAWWKARVTEALLDYGISSTWNDNNEFEIWDENAMIHGGGTPRRAVEAKPLQTLLMMQASREAQQEHAPLKRPFLISRGGVTGMQRYVQTWSGDNTTSWETLKYNIRMGLGLALSGVSNTGHDVGGFAGPAPDPELFMRWVQYGIFLPRFSIHSWNDDRSVNEPWMYPDIVGQIRALIAFRYRLMPYLYDVHWRSHRNYEPMIRPTLYDFPQDARCFDENDEMMLGTDLLVAAVVEPGATTRAVYLPKGSAWYNFWTGESFAGGQEVVLPASPAQPPLLARAGTAIPLNVAPARFNGREDRRGFAVFPPVPAGTFHSECHEDDGESLAYRDGGHGAWKIELDCDVDLIRLKIQAHGNRPPEASELTFLFPHAETRPVTIENATVTRDEVHDGFRELSVSRP